MRLNCGHAVLDRASRRRHLLLGMAADTATTWLCRFPSSSWHFAEFRRPRLLYAKASRPILLRLSGSNDISRADEAARSLKRLAYDVSLLSISMPPTSMPKHVYLRALPRKSRCHECLPAWRSGHGFASLYASIMAARGDALTWRKTAMRRLHALHLPIGFSRDIASLALVRPFGMADCLCDGLIPAHAHDYRRAVSI